MSDRKTEIKKDLYAILLDVYKMNPDVGITSRQEEFLDKAVEYLDTNLSLRRKIVKEKPVEQKEEKYVNPDRAKFDL